LTCEEKITTRFYGEEIEQKKSIFSNRKFFFDVVADVFEDGWMTSSKSWSARERSMVASLIFPSLQALLGLWQTDQQTDECSPNCVC
jgi:hypothetical protein